jgi:hypothetical protein
MREAPSVYKAKSAAEGRGERSNGDRECNRKFHANGQQRASGEKAESEVRVMENGINSEVILAARLFLAMLFLIFGWRKLMDFSGTVKRMVQDGAPLPAGDLQQQGRKQRRLQRLRSPIAADNRRR